MFINKLDNKPSEITNFDTLYISKIFLKVIKVHQILNNIPSPSLFYGVTFRFTRKLFCNMFYISVFPPRIKIKGISFGPFREVPPLRMNSPEGSTWVHDDRRLFLIPLYT